MSTTDEWCHQAWTLVPALGQVCRSSSVVGSRSGPLDRLGPDGSIQPEDTPPPKGLEVLAFAAPLAEAPTNASVVVGACVTGGDGVSPARVWLTAPVEVTPLEG